LLEISPPPPILFLKDWTKWFLFVDPPLLLFGDAIELTAIPVLTLQSYLLMSALGVGVKLLTSCWGVLISISSAIGF
jgi:hypothetical protein